MIGRPRLLSNADIARAKALIRSGSHSQTVARQMGVSRVTLVRRLRSPYKQLERRW
jgi:DNA invertase Pin-like site-specific DNA recombinase